MTTRLVALSLLAAFTLFNLSGCGSLPGQGSPGGVGSIFGLSGSHKFQCHAVSPGPCAYAIFNESGTVRETFFLAPGETREVTNIRPKTTFCLSVEKPLDPGKCQRLGLDGKPLQK